MRGGSFRTRGTPLGHRLRRLPRVGLLCAVALTVTVLAGTRAAAQPAGSPITVEGSADESGHVYTWQITNGDASPVVAVTFPHYHADLFTPPRGWTSESTYLVNVGVPDRPGTCTARVEEPTAGITRGGTASFGMRIAAKGARRGRGTIQVRFADGRELEVAGVELPQPEPVGEKYMPVIGLLAVVVVAVGWGALKRRRKSPPTTAGP